MNSVAIFQSNVFDSDAGWDESAGVQRPPAGKDCAMRIAESLGRRGIELDPDDVIEGETAWFLYPQIDNRNFEIMVSWATQLADSDHNKYWAVFIFIRTGILRRLFTRKEMRDVDLHPLQSVIEEELSALADAGIIHDIEWVTNEEFWKRFAW
jgi:hypothetical protein